MPTTTKWTLEKIKEGLDSFLKAHGRYPTVLEIDKFDLLPSSRQIQRVFGGVTKLRETLGLPADELNHTTGTKRSAVSKKAYSRGTDSERDIYSLLLSKFGEIFVHAQKPFNNYSGRIDFFVYTKNYNFGVDVFYANDMHSLIGCVNLKSNTYQDIDFDIILLSGNKDLSYENIEQLISVKKNQLKSNFKIFDIVHFKKFIDTLEPLKTY